MDSFPSLAVHFFGATLLFKKIAFHFSASASLLSVPSFTVSAPTCAIPLDLQAASQKGVPSTDGTLSECVRSQHASKAMHPRCSRSPWRCVANSSRGTLTPFLRVTLVAQTALVAILPTVAGIAVLPRA